MKKIIIMITAVVVWFACVIPYAVLGTSGGGKSGDQDFTVLAVKEDNVKDYNTMPVFEELAEDTGIDVYWTFNTGAQYSNNPDPVGINGIDAIYHSGFSNLKLSDYGKRGRIVAIDQYLDSMPNFKKILEDRPDIAEAIKSPDGHIYSLPRVEEMGLKQYPNILFINKKWLEKLIDDNNLPQGVELEKTDLVDGLDLSRAQFKAILQKFNDQGIDFDGDRSTTNEIPLSFVSNNWQGNESDLIASFGVPENAQHKTIVDGKITFTVEDDNWFRAIQELNSWYREGLIRSTSYTWTQDDFLANGQDGRYGAFYWWEKETVVKNPDDYIIVLPLKDDDGNRYVGVSNELEIEKGECVILSSCEDPAGLLSYFDKFFEPYYSAQLNYGSKDSGAFLPQLKDGKMLVPNDNHGSQSADDFRMQNAPYGVVYLTDEQWGVTVQMESRASLRLERLEAYVKPYTFKGASGNDVQSIPNLNYTEDELTELNTYESSLGNNITSWVTSAIRGNSAPTRESWQNFLEENRKSIDTVTAINQAAYDRYLTNIARGGNG